MIRISLLGTAVATTFLFTGCASIVSGNNQSLSVTTQNNGADVTGAKCSLVNDKGSWFLTSPGSVTVRRSFQDLAVDCKLDGVDAGLASVKSNTKGMAFGNILFGGFIGVGVDVATGAAYDYPELILVDMGQTKRIDGKAPKLEAKADEKAEPKK
jgi:hypothetical protein